MAYIPGWKAKLKEEREFVKKTLKVYKFKESFVYVIQITTKRGKAFYVGHTTRDVKDRLQEHLSGQGNLYVRLAAQKGALVELVHTEKFDYLLQAKQREAALISRYRHKLLNVKIEDGTTKNVDNIENVKRIFSGLFHGTSNSISDRNSSS